MQKMQAFSALFPVHLVCEAHMYVVWLSLSCISNLEQGQVCGTAM